MIRRTPGWYKEHYYDKYGISWCGRWKGHGALQKKRPDHPCLQCTEWLLRFKKAVKNLRDRVRLKLGQYGLRN